jgi:hypothetical protein
MDDAATNEAGDPRPRRVADGPPTVSLVLSTSRGWSSYRPFHESQRRALNRVGGEIIVVDGSNEVPPSSDMIGPETIWLRVPNEPSAFVLRLAGYRAARGAVVAFGEDHIDLAPDWAEAVLRAHAEHPEAAVIGGAMENGSRNELFSKAHFLVGWGRWVAPLPRDQPVRLATWGNLSFKRNALQGIRSIGGIGVNETIHQHVLARSGAVIMLDDRIRAIHVQRFGLADATRVQFHTGRTLAAYRRVRMTSAEWLRAVVTPFSPPLLLARLAWATLHRPRYLRDFVGAAPAVFWLFASRAAGELVGYATGPGDSPRRVN